MRYYFSSKVEEGVRKATEISTPVTGSSTVVGSVTGWLNEFGVAIGVILTTASFAINWYYRAKADKRAEIEHKIKTNGG